MQSIVADIRLNDLLVYSESFASSNEAERDSLKAVFLRASRAHNAERPYLLELGLPLPTSYGLDLFDTLFGTDYANAK